MPRGEKLVGRKPESYDMGPVIRVVLPIVKIYATMPRKKRFFVTTYEEEFDFAKAKLQKEGYSQIVGKLEDTTILPRLCPKCCELGGHPIFTRYKKTRSERNTSTTKNDQIRFKLHYNHSTPKSRQCFIGYLIGGSYKLSKKINPEKMNPENWINNDKIEWFEPTKMKKPRELL